MYIFFNPTDSEKIRQTFECMYDIVLTWNILIQNQFSAINLTYSM